MPDYSRIPDMDSMTSEARELANAMLQGAALLALRSRERGQAEAEQRVAATKARMQEAKELAARKQRENAARDTRTAELEREFAARMAAAGIVADPQALERDLEAERERHSAATVMQRPAMEFDSPERRLALALELAELGVEPELIEVRMMAEMAQGRPLIDAAREPITGPTPMAQVRDLDMTRERHRER